MSVFSPLDLLGSHKWSHSLFTTYALSLSFFEAVILDPLVRQGVERTLILADVDGVRSALAEHGARSAGRAYEVEPIAVKHGVFHPKLIALISRTEAHLTIGSGNVTFGGWGANLECIEHLHPEIAPDAFDDAADFLEAIATAPTLAHDISQPCGDLALELRRRVVGRTRDGHIRLVHSLGQSISAEVVRIADELGGATRLAVGAPFYDLQGTALDGLCDGLGLTHAFVHAHASGTVEGAVGTNWPVSAQKDLRPVEIDLLIDEEPRLLHAKAFEVICKRGRIVLSGSANVTKAALDADRNVELCVARITREAVSGWNLTPSIALSPTQSSLAEEGEHDILQGVLRATLKGNVLEGRVLTPFPAGEAVVSQSTAIGPATIGATLVLPDERFSLLASDLELKAWSAQRIILQIESVHGDVAQGFVSFSDLSDIRRHAGPMAPRLFAILAGTETPEDVAALMSWFQENPARMSFDKITAGDQGATGRAERSVLVSSLLDRSTSHLPSPDHEVGSLGWQRFMSLILSSFRQSRGAIDAPPDAADMAENEGLKSPSKTNRKGQPDQFRGHALAALDDLLEVILEAPPATRDICQALRIAQYVCDRLEPDPIQVRGYLHHLLSCLGASPPPAVDREFAAAAIVVDWVIQPATRTLPFPEKSARRQLLQIGFDITRHAPDMAPVRGFARLLAADADIESFWAKIAAARTPQEEVRAYREAAGTTIAIEDFPTLGAQKEWPHLQFAARDPLGNNGVFIMLKYDDVCPRCRVALPTSEASRLQRIGIAKAGSCCGKTLLCEEI